MSSKRHVVIASAVAVLCLGAACAVAADIGDPVNPNEEFETLSELCRGPGRTFDFWAGTPGDPAGRDTWWVVFDDAGCFAVGHDLGWNVVAHGPYYLTADEADRLWELVDATEVVAVGFPARPGLPTELRYRFVVREDGAADFAIWGYEALGDDRLLAVVDYVEAVIKDYLGAEAVLR
ncbi:MAG: hypothetical protein PVH29_14740 [Candidatus Zixiibacteriota bacterium]|jgi:hypothetical protein